MTTLIRSTVIAFLVAALCLAIGCRASTRTVSKDEVIHYDESYDFNDKKQIVETLVEPLIAQTFPPMGEKPVLIVYGIANRTDEHISTSGISDDIRMELVRSGKFKIVHKEQRDNIAREKSYQYNDEVAPETRIKRARQIGARYMLTGTLRSIEKKEPRQVRVKRKELKYYSLNLELTDIETSLISWVDKVEIIREASKPIIGW